MRTSFLSIFCFLLLITSSISSVSAAVLTISDLRMTSDQIYEVYVITENGTYFQGEYNFEDPSKSTFILLEPGYDYHLVLKPSPTDWFATIPTTIEYMTSSEGSRLLGMILVFALFIGGFGAIFVKTVR